MSKIKNKNPFLSLSLSFKILTFIGFLLTFAFLILKAPIYTPDTYSYSNMEVSRFPGYVICINVFKLIFGKANFDVYLVGFNLIFGFVAINYALKKISELFKLHVWAKMVLFLLFLSPYLSTLYIANNLTSEGLAYPLYLLTFSFAVEFLFYNKRRKLYFLIIALILLILTRGQFVIIPFIVAFMFCIKHKKAVFKKANIYFLILLLTVPLWASTLDKTYRKILYDEFEVSPYSYIAAITLPLFVSKQENMVLLEHQDDKNIFEFSYKRIDSLNLLSSKVAGTCYDKYMVFHNNFPLICNQNIHNQGVKYYINKGFSIPKSYVLIEKSCKRMMPILIKNNFKEYISIYFTNVLYGFKSIMIVLVLGLVLVFSLYKSIKEFNQVNGVLLLATLLIISNSLIVAIACHSINRYLFYNYFLGVLIIIILAKKLITKLK